MVFDRLFGTYKPEAADIAIRYGLVHPTRSSNPLRIVYGEFINLVRDVWAARSWDDRWRLVLMPPGWQQP